MRSLLLILLLANLLLFAWQFDVVRAMVVDARPPHPDQVSAEKLRIIRDTSTRPRRAPASPEPRATAPLSP